MKRGPEERSEEQTPDNFLFSNMPVMLIYFFCLIVYKRYTPTLLGNQNRVGI